MKNIEIYDNGGATLDRYTIVDLRTAKKIAGTRFKLYECIGASATGAGFYQHTTCQRGKHLGKKIPFIYLDGNLQQMLINEFKTV